MGHSTILIPAYNPKESLLDLINELLDNGFDKILVINDGSDVSYLPIFEKVQNLDCKVFTHAKNLGKGQALKTGFRKAMEIFDEPIIIIDCDGQHQILDIIKIDNALQENPNSLILGARNFVTDKVPTKSYLRNKITSSIFKFGADTDYKDMQTGLRGIPKCLFELALNTQGDRYEYEYNFLCQVAESFPIISVPIKTMYFDNTESSNFEPLYNWVSIDEINYHKASKIWKSCTCLFLVCYISFTLLNRFIVPQNIVTLEETVRTTESSPQTTEVEQKQIEDDTTTEPIIEPVIETIITENSYVGENIQIQISTIREYETDIYIAEIIVSDSSYLKAGLAQNSFGTNVKDKTSEIAQDNDAILAINGDYYGYRDDGYVMRNGYLYRTTQTQGGNQDLVIFDDGSMEIIEETEVSAEQLAEMGALQIFSFGPGLIADGEIIVDDSSAVSHEKESNPRTAIGMIEPNHYIFLVSDGRTAQSEGLSVEEIAIILQSYDCQVAYNLDGGGSSTMVFMGQVINNPTSNGREFKERSVSDIVFIG